MKLRGAERRILINIPTNPGGAVVVRGEALTRLHRRRLVAVVDIVLDGSRVCERVRLTDRGIYVREQLLSNLRAKNDLLAMLCGWWGTQEVLLALRRAGFTFDEPATPDFIDWYLPHARDAARARGATPRPPADCYSKGKYGQRLITSPSCYYSVCTPLMALHRIKQEGLAGPCACIPRVCPICRDLDGTARPAWPVYPSHPLDGSL